MDTRQVPQANDSQGEITSGIPPESSSSNFISEAMGVINSNITPQPEMVYYTPLQGDQTGPPINQVQHQHSNPIRNQSPQHPPLFTIPEFPTSQHLKYRKLISTVHEDIGIIQWVGPVKEMEITNKKGRSFQCPADAIVDKLQPGYVPMAHQRVKFSHINNRAFNVRHYHDGYQLAQEAHIPEFIKDDEESLEDIIGSNPNPTWNKKIAKKNRSVENLNYKYPPPENASSFRPPTNRSPSTNPKWNKGQRGGHHGNTRGYPN